MKVTLYSPVWTYKDPLISAMCPRTYAGYRSERWRTDWQTA